MAHCESMSLTEFQQRFPDEDHCEDYLFEVRWPHGFHCPVCGSDEFYPHSGRGLLQCANPQCRRQTSLTAGTIMHKTRTPLHKWFWAYFLCAKDKRGISASTLSKQIGVSHWVAWNMLQKIKTAMANRDTLYGLSGPVAIDDGFIGGPGGKRGRGTKKAKILVSVSLTEEGKPRFAKMDVVEQHSEEAVLGSIKQSVLPGSQIRTDGFESYSNLCSHGFAHQAIPTSQGYLPWVHTLISNLKCFILGTYHGVSRKHLKRYLSEFCYRFNRRFWESQLFGRLLNAAISTHPVTYAELTQ
jgi:transposase-like protein